VTQFLALLSLPGETASVVSIVSLKPFLIHDQQSLFSFSSLSQMVKKALENTRLRDRYVFFWRFSLPVFPATPSPDLRLE